MPKRAKRQHPPLGFDLSNPFYKADCEDAERTLRWLNKWDMSDEIQWIVEEKQIPAAWFAIEVLAPQNEIECRDKHAFESEFDSRWYAFVIAGKGHGKLARRQVGASSWNNRRIALCFAYRNAIRGLLPMDPNTKDAPAWTGTKQNMLANELRSQGLSRSESQRHASNIYK